jgi:hypothetical protein
VIGDDEGEDTSGNIVDAKTGAVLYPIDSSFTTDELDFFGATPHPRDGVAEEGWVGPVTSDIDGVGTLTGLEFSDQETDTFKSGAPLGTWAAGLGDESVKASTEHFTVMEGVLTCHQTYPYDYWESYEDYAADLSDDGILNSSVPDTTQAALAGLELECLELADPRMLETLGGEPGDLTMLIANEDSVITDILVDPEKNYSVTKKDDGKLLFRWGSAVKKPTDIRFQKSIPLPAEWAQVPEGEKGFTVTRAELVVRHRITNNPNDQIRPEDWENEAAIGALPEYTIGPDGYWRSTTDCYEGDGDFIPAGTPLKYPVGAMPDVPASDLQKGFTAAWYTTINRDPFQWSYELGRSRTPTDLLGDLLSGPRWRMTSNKFGQDLPSLEIPIAECTPPPYQKGEIRYETGEFTTTVINLLDWSAAEPRWDDAASPLAYSAGWTHSWATADVPGMIVEAEDAARCASVDANGDCVTDLGTTLTDDFDVSFYVKGDQKPLQVFDVQLILEYESTGTTEATLDFGDAPDAYGTFLDSNGARSMVDAVEGPYLGTSVDTELDAIEPLNGMSDTGDDGVELSTLGIGAAAYAAPTIVGDGYVNGWIDFDNSGSFDPDEQVLTDVTSSGPVRFTVPSDAVAGAYTFARFRVDDEPGAGPIGMGGIGEVEDYVVTLVTTDLTPVAPFVVTEPDMVVLDASVPAGVTTIDVVDDGTVPFDATAVMVELRASGATVPGDVTALECGGDVPAVADLAFRPGAATYASAIVPVSDTGDICLDVSKPLGQLTVEVVGYVPGLGTFDPLGSERVLDGVTLAASQLLTVPLPDMPGATGYAVTVTSSQAKGRGEVSVVTGGQPGLPILSTVPGRDATVLTVVAGADVAITSTAATRITVDVRGVFTGPVDLASAILSNGRIGVGSTVTIPAGTISGSSALLGLRAVDGDAAGVLTVVNGSASTVANLAVDKKTATAGSVLIDPTKDVVISTTAGTTLVVTRLAVMS